MIGGFAADSVREAMDEAFDDDSATAVRTLKLTVRLIALPFTLLSILNFKSLIGILVARFEHECDPPKAFESFWHRAWRLVARILSSICTLCILKMLSWLFF